MTDPLGELPKPPAIPVDEYAQRRERVRERCAEIGLDALLVWGMGGSTLDSFGDVFYLTNHYSVEPKAPDAPGSWTGFGCSCVVLPVGGSATLLTGPANWRDDLVAVEQVESGRDLYGLVVRCLSEAGVGRGRIGVAREQLLPLPLYKRILAELPDAQLVAADSVLAGLRLIKSPSEIEMMRHASAVAVRVMDAMLADVDEGRTDGDIAATGFRIATELGATPYDFAMASGPEASNAYWSRLPTFNPRRRYSRGDVVHPDIFGCVDGYFYDFQRSTIVGGAPTPAQQSVLEAAVSLVATVCDTLRVGACANDAYAASVKWRTSNGWGQALTASDLASWPAVGHGIGLGWEGPWLTQTDATPLAPGMTIAVETYCERDGVTAIHEDTVLVTDGAPEIMTSGCRARWW